MTSFGLDVFNASFFILQHVMNDKQNDYKCLKCVRVQIDHS